MKCSNCGSGKNRKQRLGWMERYTCLECGASWTDQIAAIPDRNVHNPVDGTSELVMGEEHKRRG